MLTGPIFPEVRAEKSSTRVLLMDSKPYSSPRYKCPGLGLLAPPHVLLTDSDVRVLVHYVGIRVVTHHVLLLPHEARGAHEVQGDPNPVPEPAVLVIRPVVCIMLDGNPDLGLHRAEDRAEDQGQRQARGPVESCEVGRGEDGEDESSLDVHRGRHPGVKVVLLEVLVDLLPARGVELAVLLLVRHGFARFLHRAYAKLAQQLVHVFRVVRIEQLGGVPAGFHVNQTPTRVPRYELGDVIDLSFNDEPAVLLGRVLGDLLHRKGPLLGGFGGPLRALGLARPAPQVPHGHHCSNPSPALLDPKRRSMAVQGLSESWPSPLAPGSLSRAP